VLAEYIVREALQLDGGARVPFDRVDLQWDDPRWQNGGIEVKSASAIVAWNDGAKAAANPTNPTFRIAPTLNEETGTFSRVASVFVFCVWPDSNSAHLPLDVDQWQFYVLSKSRLKERASQKTISLNVVKSLAGPDPLTHQQLRAHIESVLLHP
jgi:hypothetical protein